MGERLLESFETYGWVPDASISDDENMMDLTLLVTRTSHLKQGSMACILVRPSSSTSDEVVDKQEQDESSLLSRIQSVATNQPLYQGNNSDIHAEIAALGHAARYGRSTNQCTAYITMPPCKKCFTALYASGIARVVSLHAPPACYKPFENRVSMTSVADQHENRRRIQIFVDAAKEKEAQASNHQSDAGEPEKKKSKPN